MKFLFHLITCFVQNIAQKNIFIVRHSVRARALVLTFTNYISPDCLHCYSAKMVCVPCFIVPVLLFLWRLVVMPIYRRFFAKPGNNNQAKVPWKLVFWTPCFNIDPIWTQIHRSWAKEGTRISIRVQGRCVPYQTQGPESGGGQWRSSCSRQRGSYGGGQEANLSQFPFFMW